MTELIIAFITGPRRLKTAFNIISLLIPINSDQICRSDQFIFDQMKPKLMKIFYRCCDVSTFALYMQESERIHES